MKNKFEELQQLLKGTDFEVKSFNEASKIFVIEDKSEKSTVSFAGFKAEDVQGAKVIEFSFIVNSTKIPYLDLSGRYLAKQFENYLNNF